MGEISSRWNRWVEARKRKNFLDISVLFIVFNQTYKKFSETYFSQSDHHIQSKVVCSPKGIKEKGKRKKKKKAGILGKLKCAGLLVFSLEPQWEIIGSQGAPFLGTAYKPWLLGSCSSLDFHSYLSKPFSLSEKTAAAHPNRHSAWHCFNIQLLPPYPTYLYWLLDVESFPSPTFPDPAALCVTRWKGHSAWGESLCPNLSLFPLGVSQTYDITEHLWTAV